MEQVTITLSAAEMETLERACRVLAVHYDDTASRYEREGRTDVARQYIADRNRAWELSRHIVGAKIDARAQQHAR